MLMPPAEFPPCLQPQGMRFGKDSYTLHNGASSEQNVIVTVDLKRTIFMLKRTWLDELPRPKQWSFKACSTEAEFLSLWDTVKSKIGWDV